MTCREYTLPLPAVCVLGPLGNTGATGLRGCVSAVIDLQKSLCSPAFVEIILHQPTGVYTSLAQHHPTQFNTTGASARDYVATYNGDLL